MSELMKKVMDLEYNLHAENSKILEGQAKNQILHEYEEDMAYGLIEKAKEIEDAREQKMLLEHFQDK